jgi:hypothetical protein
MRSFTQKLLAEIDPDAVDEALFPARFLAVAQSRAPVDARDAEGEVPVADVVGEDEHHVRLLVCGERERRGPQKQRA